MEREVPVEVLRERFDYDPQSGVVSFRYSSGRAKAGCEAGTINSDGYRIIRVIYEGRRIQIAAHVIAWAIHHGSYPNADVDHKDTIRTHNHIDNLRDASRSMNLANRNPTGPYPKGVSLDKKHKTKPYRARIEAYGKKTNLGNYACPYEAHAAYRQAALKTFGEFARF